VSPRLRIHEGISTAQGDCPPQTWLRSFYFTPNVAKRSHGRLSPRERQIARRAVFGPEQATVLVGLGRLAARGEYGVVGRLVFAGTVLLVIASLIRKQRVTGSRRATGKGPEPHRKRAVAAAEGDQDDVWLPVAEAAERLGRFSKWFMKTSALPRPPGSKARCAPPTGENGLWAGRACPVRLVLGATGATPPRTCGY
jgi:hypothetical protein